MLSLRFCFLFSCLKMNPIKNNLGRLCRNKKYVTHVYHHELLNLQAALPFTYLLRTCAYMCQHLKHTWKAENYSSWFTTSCAAIHKRQRCFADGYLHWFKNIVHTPFTYKLKHLWRAQYVPPCRSPLNRSIRNKPFTHILQIRQRHSCHTVRHRGS